MSNPVTNPNAGVGVLAVDLTGQDFRIGIVQARFNETHCVALSNACIQELITLGVAQEDIRLVTVPGALEIPFALQKLAETGEFDGLVALGAVTAVAGFSASASADPDQRHHHHLVVYHHHHPVVIFHRHHHDQRPNHHDVHHDDHR